MNQLPIFLNLKDRPVIVLGDGDAAAAKTRLVTRAGGYVVGEDDLTANVAIVAIDDEDEAVAAVARLKQRGLLVNAVDRPQYCDFTTPAIIDRDPVLIAIGTGGASAGLAKALRQRFETVVPAGLGTLAAALFAARPRIAARWAAPAERRRAIDAALAANGPLDPLADGDDTRLEQWLSGNATPQTTGLFTVQLTSNDPDDLTLKQLRLLGSADTVYHDAQIAPDILARIRADAMVMPLTVDQIEPVAGEIIIMLSWAID